MGSYSPPSWGRGKGWGLFPLPPGGGAWDGVYFPLPPGGGAWDGVYFPSLLGVEPGMASISPPSWGRGKGWGLSPSLLGEWPGMGSIPPPSWGRGQGWGLFPLPLGGGGKGVGL